VKDLCEALAETAGSLALPVERTDAIIFAELSNQHIGEIRNDGAGERWQYN
jgi:hypothetical protein